MLKLFNYIGGKYYLLKYILERIDTSKKCFIELFGGSGKVFMNVSGFELKIYNDIDPRTCAIFNAVIRNKDEFLNRLNSIKLCEKLYYDLINYEPKTELDIAVKYFIIYNQSFNSYSNSFTYSYKRNRRWNYNVELIDNIYYNIKDSWILNFDYKYFLELVKDCEDIMMYVDPPYWGSEHYYEFGNFNRQDHFILAEYLNKAKYSVLVSYYYFNELETMYPRDKWVYEAINVPKYSTGSKGNKKRTDELLIRNYGNKIPLDK